MKVTKAWRATIEEKVKEKDFGSGMLWNMVLGIDVPAEFKRKGTCRDLVIGGRKETVGGEDSSGEKCDMVASVPMKETMALGSRYGATVAAGVLAANRLSSVSRLVPPGVFMQGGTRSSSMNGDMRGKR